MDTLWPTGLGPKNHGFEEERRGYRVCLGVSVIFIGHLGVT